MKDVMLRPFRVIRNNNDITLSASAVYDGIRWRKISIVMVHVELPLMFKEDQLDNVLQSFYIENRLLADR